MIWTTTPWTIPANLAISVHPEVEYAIVEPLNEKINYLFAKERIPFLETTLNSKFTIKGTFFGILSSLFL